MNETQYFWYTIPLDQHTFSFNYESGVLLYTVILSDWLNAPGLPKRDEFRKFQENFKYHSRFIFVLFCALFELNKVNLSSYIQCSLRNNVHQINEEKKAR